jgi:hypothetical protein
MRDVIQAAVHTAGYVLLTGMAVWLAFQFAPTP